MTDAPVATPAPQADGGEQPPANPPAAESANDELPEFTADQLRAALDAAGYTDEQIRRLAIGDPSTVAEPPKADAPQEGKDAETKDEPTNESPPAPTPAPAPTTPAPAATTETPSAAKPPDTGVGSMRSTQPGAAAPQTQGQAWRADIETRSWV